MSWNKIKEKILLPAMLTTRNMGLPSTLSPGTIVCKRERISVGAAEAAMMIGMSAASSKSMIIATRCRRTNGRGGRW